MAKLVLVVAMAENRVIGRDGDLPWRLPEDLKRFKAVTMGKPIVMGRKTWDSLPRKPLPGRPNFVVTRQTGFAADGAISCSGLPEALAAAGRAAEALGVDEICLIGGGMLYEQALPLAQRIDLTEVRLSPDGDTRFPYLPESEWREAAREPMRSETGIAFDLVSMERISETRL